MSAKVILDTENPVFIERVLTMELEFPKFILAEFSKHRNISFNTSSSRAIPVSKMLETIEEYPVNFQWTKKGPGMSGERLDKDSPTFKNADDIAMEIRNFLIKKVRQLEIIQRNLQRQQQRICLLYTSPSPRDPKTSRMPSSA